MSAPTSGYRDSKMKGEGMSSGGRHGGDAVQNADGKSLSLVIQAGPGTDNYPNKDERNLDHENSVDMVDTAVDQDMAIRRYP